jgi:hypothetical protein
VTCKIVFIYLCSLSTISVFYVFINIKRLISQMFCLALGSFKITFFRMNTTESFLGPENLQKFQKFDILRET